MPEPRNTERTIRLTGVRQNNLKNITAVFPARKLSVVTGLSGSGKSSLAFDTLYAEGQRRYIESLSTYTRQFLEKMPKPDLDAVENIPPAIALEQRNHVVNFRSTVGTQTEIVDYLRVLFAKVGKTHCLNCGNEVKRIDADTILEQSLKWFLGKKGAIAAPLYKTTPAGKSKRPSVESILQLVREQGFRRVLLRKSESSIQTLDLDELDTPAFPKIPGSALTQDRLWAVVDRLKFSGTADSELRARLLDSITQATRAGQGRLAFFDLDLGESKVIDTRFCCVECGREHRMPEPNLFSFNSPLGACPKCSGFGFTLDIDESLVVPDPAKTLKNGAIDPLSKPSFDEWQKDFFRFSERHGISIGKRYRELTASEKALLWNGDPKDTTFPGILVFFQELARKKYKLHVRVFIRRYQSQTLCPDCQGARLSPDALAVKINSTSISEFLAKSAEDALKWIDELTLTKNEAKIASEIFAQIRRRLSFLVAVGVGYLTLSRLAKTLSGGEFQRINLSTQLGNGLCGTLYVLDEPSIGLHAADTSQLIGVLKDLRDQGNTVVVVEHDLEMMKAADWLVELGPGAGKRGGELIAQGNADALIQEKGSLTGKYLSGAFRLERTKPARGEARKKLKITGCKQHNLQAIDVEFPLERFVIVTGVSGSGKSTLVHKTLYKALQRIYEPASIPEESVGAYDQLYGAENLSGIVLLDQSPIGRNSRSNPATYMKAWDEIRRLFANQVVSLRRGYTPQHFSFNVDGGRCPVCKGEGEITLDMHFMAEVKIPCDECSGKRFKKPILDVTYRGLNISKLLHTTIDEAFDLFRDNPILARKLGILREVGLGYLQVGQPAPTLSGGESQRLKIASALDERESQNLLYVFDEPTTGLHLEDIKKLLLVIQDLVEARHSVIMIEHQLDVIAQADWVIDLGPGGGTRGGKLMAAGPPEKIVRNENSVTGKMLTEAGYHFPSRSETG